MPLEIERKYLLKYIPSIVNQNIQYNDNNITDLTSESKIEPSGYDKIYNIVQHYAGNGERFRKRNSLGCNDYEYFITKKSEISFGVFDEDEQEVEGKEWSSRLSKINTGLRTIEKIRYIKIIRGFYADIPDLKFEADAYKNIKLATLEVELPHIDYEFIIPFEFRKAIIMEVTGIKEFSNQNLAR